MSDISLEKPETLGIDPEKLDELAQRVRREVDAGILPSCQYALARHGRLAAFEAVGACTPESRFTIYSATKAFVASAAWLLLDAGDLQLERRVAEYIPEFGTNGKDVVTVEQVLLHTSGFPRAPLGPPKWADRAERLAAFSAWRLNWEPGTQYEYHPTAAHWVLAELIERVSGIDYRDFIEQRVTRPLGLARVLGIPVAEQGDVLDVVEGGEPTSPDELEAVLGVRELDLGEVTDEALLLLNEPDVRAVGIPGGGGVTTAATVALFYQELLHNTKGLWDPENLANATGKVWTSLPDPLYRVPASRGLGVVIAGDDGKAPLRGFGHTQSPRTFGHNGAAGQIAWADPESGLSFCYLTNGHDLDIIRQGRRGVGITSRAARCAQSS
ncbi:MAG: serine hydrolase domain-containing protein [Acidimicrobiales bacterium]